MDKDLPAQCLRASPEPRTELLKCKKTHLLQQVIGENLIMEKGLKIELFF